MSNKTKTEAKEKQRDRIKFQLPDGLVLLVKPKDKTKDFHCVRCQYEWATRKESGEIPARCPHCSSPSWNKARLRASSCGPECRCKFCGWKWVAVCGRTPAQCPQCKKFNWLETAGLPSAKPAGVN